MYRELRVLILCLLVTIELFIVIVLVKLLSHGLLIEIVIATVATTATMATKATMATFLPDFLGVNVLI